MELRRKWRTPARTLLAFSFLWLAACGLVLSDDKRLERAEQALAAGEYRAAVIDTKNVLLRDPDNTRARVVLGRASLADGDAVTAEKELSRAVELGAPVEVVAQGLAQALLLQSRAADALVMLDDLQDSSLTSDALFHRLRGDALIGVGQAESARASYRNALALDPEDVSSQIGVAASYAQDGNLAQALHTIDEIAASYPQNVNVWLMSASLHNLAGNPMQAIAQLETGRSLAEEQADASSEAKVLHALIEIHLTRADAGEAKRWHARLMEVAPDAVGTRLSAAKIAVQHGSWEEAQDLLLALLRDVPRYVPAQVLLGATYLELGSPGQAKVYLADAIREVPDHPKARMLLAEARLRLNETATAQLALDPLLSVSVADPAALRLAARISLNAGDTATAADYLRQTLAQDPDNIERRLQVALALITFGEVDEAESLLRTIDEDYHSADGLLRRDTLDVLASLRRGDLDHAQKLALAIVERRPESADAYNLFGSVELHRRNFDAARRAFENAVRISGNHVHALRNYAAVDEAAGDLDGAALRYRRILELEPEAVWAMLALARIAGAQNDHKGSIDWLREVVAAKPATPIYRARLALALYQQGEKVEARELVDGLDRAFLTSHLPTGLLLSAMLIEEGEVDQAMQVARELGKRYSDSPIPLALMGEAYAAKGDLSEAFESYAKAVSISPMKSHAVRAYIIGTRAGRSDRAEPLDQFLGVHPDAFDVLLLRAEAFMRDNEHERAATAYERVLEANPDNFVALNNLAWAYRDADTVRATSLARKAHAIQPENASVLDTLGWLLVKQGHLDEGIRRLRDALERSSDNPQIRLHLATALVEAGQIDEARVLLEELLAGYASSQAATSAKELLASL